MQHAFVVPTHGYSICGTALDYVFCCVSDAALAGVYGEVAAAEEEAVDCVDGVPGSGVVEFNVACGVGWEVCEEVIEIWLVGTVGGESGGVWTFMMDVSCNGLSSGMAEEADQKVKDQKGHAQVESARLRQTHYHDQLNLLCFLQRTTMFGIVRNIYTRGWINI